MTGTSIEVVINGEIHRLPEAMTMAQLLLRLELRSRKHIAVERNKELVAKDLFESTQLQAGDRLEIVSFVGGG